MNQLSEIIKTLNFFATSIENPNDFRRLRLEQGVKILEQLEEYEVFDERLTASDFIWAYYVTAKNVGHTELMRKGIEGYDKPFTIVIAADGQREEFKGFKTIKYNDLNQIVGTGYPLAWDNKAVVRLLSSFSIVQSCFRKIRNILESK